MKNQRGFSLELILMAVAAVALMGGVGWLLHKGAEGERDKQRKQNAEERAARTEMISGLAVNLSKSQEETRKERIARETAALAYQREREGRANEFIPKVAGSDSCIRVGWVRYTNAAAAGVPLGLRPGPGVAEAPAGVGTDSVGATVARNYDKYTGCKATVAGILKEFDTKRQASNSVIDAINERVKRAERRLQ